MAYSTATDVKNQSVNNAVAQAQWSDPADINLRIAEGDARTDSRLAALGYSLPFASTPPLVFQMSVAYARYAVMRDIYGNKSPSQDPAQSAQKYLDEWNAMFQDLQEGRAFLVDSAGGIVPSEPVSQRFRNAADGVPRMLTMNDPEALDNAAPPEYTDSNLLGD